ncbi:MAG: hypothetical protein ACMXYC_04695 [Candidatus Woesearchaeota archaeon]
MKRSSIYSHYKNKDKENKKILLFFILAGLMVASIFGVIFYSTDSPTNQATTEYGIQFRVDSSGQFLKATIDRQEYDFFFLPSQVVMVPMDIAHVPNDMFQYLITHEPDELLDEYIDYARFMISSDLEHIPVAFEEFTNQTCMQDITFVLRQANTTHIYQQDNCYFIEGTDVVSFVEAVEKFRYTILGVQW